MLDVRFSNYYGHQRRRTSPDWGGRFLAGNALVKNQRFDVMLGTGVLSKLSGRQQCGTRCPQKQDLVFLQIFPRTCARSSPKENKGELVQPCRSRYLRGPRTTSRIRPVGLSGLVRLTARDGPARRRFVRERHPPASTRKRSLIKWANPAVLPYDPNTVWDGEGRAAARRGGALTYREPRLYARGGRGGASVARQNGPLTSGAPLQGPVLPAGGVR